VGFEVEYTKDQKENNRIRLYFRKTHTFGVEIASSEHPLTHPTVPVALLTFRRDHQGVGDTMWGSDNR